MIFRATRWVAPTKNAENRGIMPAGHQRTRATTPAAPGPIVRATQRVAPTSPSNAPTPAPPGFIVRATHRVAPYGTRTTKTYSLKFTPPPKSSRFASPITSRICTNGRGFTALKSQPLNSERPASVLEASPSGVVTLA